MHLHLELIFILPDLWITFFWQVHLEGKVKTMEVRPAVMWGVVTVDQTLSWRWRGRRGSDNTLNDQVGQD